MRLSDARRAFLALLARGEAVETFRAAGRRHVVLGLYAEPVQAIDDLLGITRAVGLAWGRGADALLRAVVLEYQTSTSDVWPAMLLVIFYPLLTGLKRRAVTRLEPADLEGTAVAALLADARALRNVASADRLAMRIEQETRRRLWQALGTDLRDGVLLQELVADAQARGWMEPFRGGRRDAQPLAVNAVALAALVDAHALAAPEAREIFTRELGGLRELTRKQRPDLEPAEQDRLYQRVRRRLARQRARGEPTSAGALARALDDGSASPTAADER